MHDNQGSFECTHCQRSFSAKGSLDYHVRVKHSVSEDVSLQCEKCNISCTDLQDLKIHKKTHVQNFKMKCHLCSLMLKKKSLAGHIIEVHNIELRYDADKLNFPVYPYECTECDFVCKRKIIWKDIIEPSTHPKNSSARNVEKSLVMQKH